MLFAREGADVAIQYLCEHADAETTKAAVEAEGRRAILIPGDVGEPRVLPHGSAPDPQGLGRLDILVNNAAFQSTCRASRTSAGGNSSYAAHESGRAISS